MILRKTRHPLSWLYTCATSIYCGGSCFIKDSWKKKKMRREEEPLLLLSTSLFFLSTAVLDGVSIVYK